MKNSIDNYNNNIEQRKIMRESNIELYRIVLMILIIAHHYVVNSGLLEVLYSQDISAKSIAIFVIGAWGKIGINCFLLITGYFMCKSNITIKKFLKLFLEVVFYNIVIYAVFVISGYEKFSIIQFARSLLPISDIAQNFTECFLIFYLFIPFINILIKNINEKKHLLLIGLLFFMYSILGNIPKINVIMNYVSLYTFIYLIGSYIRLYPKKWFDKRKIISIVTFIFILLCVISVVVCVFLSKELKVKMAYYFVNDSNKVLVVLTALFLFLWFKGLKIKPNKLINTVASTIFGVLMIHANSDIMRKFLWNDLLKNVEVYNANNLAIVLLYLFASVFGVFFICSIIDLIRIKLIENNLFKKLDKILEEKENNFIKWSEKDIHL